MRERLGPKMASAPSEPLQPEETSVRAVVRRQAYILMGITGIGYLALTWSTVVLLGGFVTALGKKDFWCLTIISMLQASRIFNDLNHRLVPSLTLLWRRFYWIITDSLAAFRKNNGHQKYKIFFSISLLYCICIIASPMMAAYTVLSFIYSYGAIACVVLSSWRIWQHDYSITDGDNSKANLIPALFLFYSLVLFQGVLWVIWAMMNSRGPSVVISLRQKCNFPERWGREPVAQYLRDTQAKCCQDPASINGINLINHAVKVLDSESQEGYLSGARMVDVFIKRGVDVRSLILPSRPKIQKLIDTVRWRSSDREMRECAARIVAHLAWDIDLTQFPGAIRCISSLLDTTLPCCNNHQADNHQHTQLEVEETTTQEMIMRVEKLEQRRAKKSNQKGSDQKGEVDRQVDHCWNELILQGLAILERLASDQHNCRDICSTPELLPKIMKPIYSDTLIQDINVWAWKDVVTGSLKVVHRLIRAPGWAGRKLRREISSSKQAVSNLEGILDQVDVQGQELQMHAIQILTELAFDLSSNLSRETKENLIKKQLQIFLPGDEGEEETVTYSIELKVTAGITLSLLSETDAASRFIMGQRNNIIDYLSEILDPKNKIIYRTIAAEILKNLFTHCTWDKERVKESLLPKVLKEVLPSKRELQTESSQRKSATGDDVEKQLSEHSSQNKSSNKANVVQPAMKELQEALLSLSLVICDRLINADDSDNVAAQITLGDADFLAKLKTIVDESCQATANCLRIVKLCSQIALLMMSDSQYTPQSEDKEFVESVSKASKMMSNAESCMLFAGTNCGAKNTVRPLLSNLEKDLRKKCPKLDRP